MSFKISGVLQAKEKMSLADNRVEAFYTLLGAAPVETPAETKKTRKAVDKTQPLTHEKVPPQPGRASARTNEAGEFSFEFPDRKFFSGHSIRFVVSAPAGQTIGSLDTTLEAVKDRVTIPVTPVAGMNVPPVKDPPKPPTVRISGRIIERNGRTLPSDLQVLLFAHRKGDPEEQVVGTDAPVLAARADARGYFFGDAPNDTFDAAAALIAGVSDELPVRVKDGTIPSPVLLVVDLGDMDPAAKDDGSGCGCDDGNVPPRTPGHEEIEAAPGTYSTDLGTGKCVRFNTPNRSIEEFSFYTVVRTTEPDIRGYTLPPNNPQGTTVVVPPPPPGGGSGSTGNVPPPPPGYTPGNGTGYAPPPPPNTGYNYPPPGSTPSNYHGATPVNSADGGSGTHAATAVYAATAAPAGGVQTLNVNRTDAQLSTTESANYWVGQRMGPIPTAQAASSRPPGRAYMSATNPVDWDVTPTFYEATTIAHGHLLHFKQVWYADGYSLGDLLYSLPLAPGQKKLISVVDWERRERANRDDATTESEALSASLSRDRDLSEVVTGALTESARGGSSNTTTGVGVGTGAAGNGSYQGFNFGALLGVSGGYGNSNTDAWQDSARDLSSTSMQTLRDRTMQSASAVRGTRSTVVQTVAQGEAVRATTEVIANHNHCHAVTIQYFEVLRHLKLTHELADVQECLFVPLPMAEYDRTKALRWRQSLQTYLQRRELLPGFDALRRIETNWVDSEFPAARYGDESINSLAGELEITIMIPLPPFPERPKPKPEDPADVLDAVNKAAAPTTGALGILLAVATGGASLIAGAVTQGAIDATKAVTQGARSVADALYDQPTAQERYDKFQAEVMPGVAEGFVDQLELWALVGTTARQIGTADFTLVSSYQPGTPLLVGLRATLPGSIRRSDVSQLMIRSSAGLPSGCRVIVNSAAIRYRSTNFEHALVDDRRVNDDIDLPKVFAKVADNGWEVTIQMLAEGTGATLYTPLDAWEQRNPRKDDLRIGSELIEHLNNNLEYYHHASWWTMDPSRRYMLLDGYLAPGSGDRSVASVVENRLVGIVGNSLILPVARGVHLDPRFQPDPKTGDIDLLEHYALDSPIAPVRVSLPTRGVFAEAVMGSCNSCEPIDDSRFWRWEDSPIDEPPGIDNASTSTRRTDPGNLQPTPLPTPIVSIQNAPAAPDPAGVRAALDLLGKQSFADITGIAGTQANAAMAYSKALDTAFAFGKEASTLAQQAAVTKSLDKTMSAIDKAEQDKKISADDAKSLRVAALKKSIGDDTSKDSATDSVQKKLDVVKKAQDNKAVTPSAAEKVNTDLLASLVPSDNSTTTTNAGAELLGQVDPDNVSNLSVTPDGGVVLANYTKPAPASKTGVSGVLADKQGNTSGGAQLLLDGSKELIDKFGDALIKWRNAPDATITDAMVDTIFEAATEAADDITNEVPLIKAMKLAAKYSLVLADGIDAGIDQANKTLRPIYQRAENYQDTGNGIDPDDYNAILFARRWQANDVSRLSSILQAGVAAMLQQAASDFSEWVTGAAAKKIFSLGTSVATHLLNKTPIKGIALNVVNAVADRVPELRRELYGTAVGITLSLWVKQLENPKLRQKLLAITNAPSAKKIDEAVIKAIASTLVQGAVGDPKAKDGSSLLSNLREDSREWLLGFLNKKIGELTGGVTVAGTQGPLTVVGDEIRIPSAILNAATATDPAVAAATYDRGMKALIAIGPLRQAAAGNLTLLARTQRLKIIPLTADGVDANLAPQAYDAYWNQVTAICKRVTKAYIDAGADPDAPTPLDTIDFETFNVSDPEVRRVGRYDLIGENGGGVGHFWPNQRIFGTMIESNEMTDEFLRRSN